MENCIELDCFVNNVKAILPLANCHMVSFITQKLFVNVLPKCIQNEIMAMGIDELNDLFLNRLTGSNPESKNAPSSILNFLFKADMLSLKQNRYCHSVEDLCAKLQSKGLNEVGYHKVEHLMSQKKSHEVEIMGGIIAAITKAEHCSHIVDIGGGKGYLSSFLALNYKLKVLSVDSSLTTSKGAAKQLPKAEKLMTVHHKYKSISEKKSDAQIKVEKNISQLCKLATSYVSESTDLVQLITDHFPEDEVGKIMLIGLHTCGNLAPSSLRLFTSHPENIQCLINVGCCYNLLIEEYDSTPLWLEEESRNSGYGFPMSTCLKNLRFSLGRNARMLAAQPPDRVLNTGMFQTESLFYRALLEFYLQKKLGSLNNFPQFRIGKLSKKCINFVEYAQKSVTQLGIDIEIDEKELQQLYDDHEPNKKQLHAFYLLRLAVAPAIEAAIMLDRLAYLHEQGIEAYLTQLFDPVVSPRCYAVVAFNKLNNRD